MLGSALIFLCFLRFTHPPPLVFLFALPLPPIISNPSPPHSLCALSPITISLLSLSPLPLSPYIRFPFSASNSPLPHPGFHNPTPFPSCSLLTPFPIVSAPPHPLLFSPAHLFLYSSLFVCLPLPFASPWLPKTYPFSLLTPYLIVSVPPPSLPYSPANHSLYSSLSSFRKPTPSPSHSFVTLFSRSSLSLPLLFLSALPISPSIRLSFSASHSPLLHPGCRNPTPSASHSFLTLFSLSSLSLPLLSLSALPIPPSIRLSFFASHSPLLHPVCHNPTPSASHSFLTLFSLSSLSLPLLFLSPLPLSLYPSL